MSSTDGLTDYEARRVAGMIRVVQLIITTADNQGMTHGEKHHMMVTALELLRRLQDNELKAYLSPQWTYQVSDVVPNDIPF